MAGKAPPSSPGPEGPGQVVIYRDGATRLQVRLEGRTVWLSQRLIAELYQVSVPTVNEHLGQHLRRWRTRPRGNYSEFPNSSARGQPGRLAGGGALQPRRHPRRRLPRPLRTGARRSGSGPPLACANCWSRASCSTTSASRPGARSARTTSTSCSSASATSARRSGCSTRRSPTSTPPASTTTPRTPITQTFFATVQNKLHWAIHGHTAAEVIVERADASRPHMGLTTWKNAPQRPDSQDRCDDRQELPHRAGDPRTQPRRLDVPRLRRGPGPPPEADAHGRLGRAAGCFLQFNERNILTHAGTVSHELAEERAQAEFEKYEVERRRMEAAQPTSDFDRAVQEVKRLEAGTSGRNTPVKRPMKEPVKKKASRRRKQKRDKT